MGMRQTTEDFITKSKKRHGDTYCYGKSEYISVHDKITVTCRTHGDFLVAPKNHYLRGSGCPECGRLRTAEARQLDTGLFVACAIETHGDTYTYGNTEYVCSRDKLVITCKKHGDFLQKANAHLNGAGCPECGAERVVECQTSDVEEFVAKANAVHGGLYSYTKTVYSSSQSKVLITCNTHGDFEQRPNDHLQGRGCPSCSTLGFNPSKPAFVYFLLDTETHSRVKIGISNNPDKRLTELKRGTPFSIDRIELFETPSEITLQIEALCHYQLESANLKGFDGATEWFKFDGGKLEALRAFILSFGVAAK